METILITGASGFLGSCLLNQLISLGKYQLFTLSRSKEQLQEKYEGAQGLKHFDLNDFHQNKMEFDKIDTIIHCAFARAIKGGCSIGESLEFSRMLFEKAKSSHINSIINISTQEVYGKASPPWKESMVVDPQTVYGFAKYYSELMAMNLFDDHNTSICNLRLPGLLGKDTDARLVNKFVQNAIEGKPINITGGDQQFSQLYVQDASDGIIALLNTPVQNRKPLYNLGYLKSYNIIEIANVVSKVAKDLNLPDVKISLTRTDSNVFAELDSSDFFKDINWKPQFDMERVVREIFEFKINKQK